MDESAKQLGAIVIAVAVVLALILLWNTVVQPLISKKVKDEMDKLETGTTSFEVPAPEWDVVVEPEIVIAC